MTDQHEPVCTGKYRKKPVVVEAVQITGDNWDTCVALVNKRFRNPDTTHRDTRAAFFCTTDGNIWIRIDNGFVVASEGDWIIEGVRDPCKPDIFAATYEPTPASYQSAINSTDTDRCTPAEQEPMALSPMVWAMEVADALVEWFKEGGIHPDEKALAKLLVKFYAHPSPPMDLGARRRRTHKRKKRRQCLN